MVSEPVALIRIDKFLSDISNNKMESKVEEKLEPKEQPVALSEKIVEPNAQSTEPTAENEQIQEIKVTSAQAEQAKDSTTVALLPVMTKISENIHTVGFKYP